MKPYAAVIVFLTLVLSSVLTSLNSYNRTKATIVNDMNHALALTLSQQQEAWITPDTIMNYRQNLKIEVLRNESFVTYALANTPKVICSKPMKWIDTTTRTLFSSRMPPVLSSPSTAFPTSVLLLCSYFYPSFGLPVRFIGCANVG